MTKAKKYDLWLWRDSHWSRRSESLTEEQALLLAEDLADEVNVGTTKLCVYKPWRIHLHPAGSGIPTTEPVSGWTVSKIGHLTPIRPKPRPRKKKTNANQADLFGGEA